MHLHMCVCLLVSRQTLFNKVQLVAVGLVTVGHANLSHVGFADVVAFRTILQVVSAKEVCLLLFV